MKKASLVFWLLITIIPVIGIAISLSDPQSFEVAQEHWQGKVLVFGALAPLAFILLQAA